MHYTGPTFRPPYEANSLLLQVTAGCSHNACTFCVMYQNMPYRVSPLSEVQADLVEASQRFPHIERVFLENGDAFSLPTSQLVRIGELIHEHLPNVRVISGYASVRNFVDKTDEDLRALRDLGFREFNVGLESGLDDVLGFLNKGYDLETARTQLLRLREAGIPFTLNIINAAAGPARLHEHAAANAKIVNEVQPALLFVTPLHVDKGSALERIVDDGGFKECTLGQYLDEQIEMLEQLELENCLYFGVHISNPVKTMGWLPRDKQQLLDELRAGRDRFSPQQLDSHPAKGLEGRMVL